MPACKIHLVHQPAFDLPLPQGGPWRLIVRKEWGRQKSSSRPGFPTAVHFLQFPTSVPSGADDAPISGAVVDMQALLSGSNQLGTFHILKKYGTLSCSLSSTIFGYVLSCSVSALCHSAGAFCHSTAASQAGTVTWKLLGFISGYSTPLHWPSSNIIISNPLIWPGHLFLALGLQVCHESSSGAPPPA